MNNLPFETVVPQMRKKLIEHAGYLKDRGMPNAALTISEAAALIQQLFELHKGLVAREERLTTELVALRK